MDRSKGCARRRRARKVQGEKPVEEFSPVVGQVLKRPARLKRTGTGALPRSLMLLTLLFACLPWGSVFAQDVRLRSATTSATSSGAADAEAVENIQSELSSIDRRYQMARPDDIATLKALADELNALRPETTKLQRVQVDAAYLLAQIERDRLVAGDPAGKAGGLRAIRDVLSHIDDSTDIAADVWMTYGQLIGSPLSTVPQADLHAAIDAFSKSAKLSHGHDPKLSATAMLNRAVASTFVTGPGSAAIIETIAELKAVINDKSLDRDPQVAHIAQLNLAGAYLQRQTGDRTDNVEIAIRIYEQLLAATDKQRAPKTWARLAGNSAEALVRARLDQEKRYELAEQRLTDAAAILEHSDTPDAAFDPLVTLADLRSRRGKWGYPSEFILADQELASASRHISANPGRLSVLASERAELLGARHSAGDRAVTAGLW